MNYSNHYVLLIDKAKSEKRKKGKTYYEDHHIVPRSEGGTDNKENLVLLTAREHYIAHWLLFRESPTQSRAFAFWRMNTKNVNQSSRGYEEAREAHAYHMSKLRKSTPREESTIAKMEVWRKAALKEGLHPFQQPKSEAWKTAHSERQKELVVQGNHNFNSTNTRNWALNRIRKGEHHFLSSDFNKEGFEIYLNGSFLASFESKVDAVRQGVKAGVVDKLRKLGAYRVEKGSSLKKATKELFVFKKNDILEYKKIISYGNKDLSRSS